MYSNEVFSIRSDTSDSDSNSSELRTDLNLTKTRSPLCQLSEFQCSGSSFFDYRDVPRFQSTSTDADETTLTLSQSYRKRSGSRLEDCASTDTPNCSGVGEGYLRVPDVISSYRTPGVFKFRRRTSLEPQIDYISHLRVPNECILNVFRFLNKRDLINAMRVSKRFYNVGEASELWQCLDISNRMTRMADICRILSRGSKVLRLCGTTITEDEENEVGPNSSLITSSEFFVRLTHLDLSRSVVSEQFVQTVLSGCGELRCLSLENCHLNDTICSYLSKNPNMTHLDLSMTRGITSAGLQLFLPICERLEELNISWCDLDESAVEAVCSLLTPNIKKLNISGTKDKQSILDEHVLMLTHRCRYLIELDLSDSPSLSQKALVNIINMSSLETLSLSRCFGIHPLSFLQLVSIARLNIFGCVTDEGESTLRIRLPDTAINHSPFSHVARPTPPPSVTSIWGVKTKDLY